MNEGLVRRENLLRALKELGKPDPKSQEEKNQERENLYKMYYFFPTEFYRLLGGTS